MPAVSRYEDGVPSVEELGVIREFLDECIAPIYQDCLKWFDTKVVPDVTCEKRVIIRSYDEHGVLCALAIVKRVPHPKICTLYVKKAYRKKGIGYHLMRKAIAHSGSEFPECKMYAQAHSLLQPLLNHFKFKLTAMSISTIEPIICGKSGRHRKPTKVVEMIYNRPF